MPDCPKETDSESPPSDWVTIQYMENILRKIKKDQTVKVTKCVLSPATAKDENFASEMNRVTVEYLSASSRGMQKDSFIVKTAFQGDVITRSKLNDFDVYNREIEMFDNIIPLLNELLQEAGDNDKLFPEAVHVDRNHLAVIFEDLAKVPYVLGDKSYGFDLDHTKMVVKKLAKMHATSAVLSERRPGIFRTYDRGMYNRHHEAFRSYFVTNLQVLSDLLKKWKGYEHYAEKLEKLKPMLMEYGKRAFDAKAGRFNALNHGDIWVNNIMFSYKNQIPSDVLLIDLQYTVWTSPSIDLHYFFNTSLQEDVRMNRQEELVQYYHKNLTSLLRALNYKGKILSLREFWLQYIETSFYAFHSACIIQPVIRNENSDGADPEAVFSDSVKGREFKELVYRNERTQSKLKELIPIFDRRGLIDIQ